MDHIRHDANGDRSRRQRERAKVTLQNRTNALERGGKIIETSFGRERKGEERRREEEGIGMARTYLEKHGVEEDVPEVGVHVWRCEQAIH